MGSVLSGQYVALTYPLTSVAIGLVATRAAPPGASLRSKAVAAAVVSGTLILVPIMAFGPAFLQ
ncbi:hypothetical protein [Streptacidiphilus sp. MAP12-16]|uniref:hypothetical protein n=1 Tax=Streptacidiphilus sp. MAP12-16 TaxID=3156300 RepID=UPI003517EABF